MKQNKINLSPKSQSELQDQQIAQRKQPRPASTNAYTYTIYSKYGSRGKTWSVASRLVFALRRTLYIMLLYSGVSFIGTQEKRTVHIGKGRMACRLPTYLSRCRCDATICPVAVSKPLWYFFLEMYRSPLRTSNGELVVCVPIRYRCVLQASPPHERQGTRMPKLPSRLFPT